MDRTKLVNVGENVIKLYNNNVDKNDKVEPYDYHDLLYYIGLQYQGHPPDVIYLPGDKRLPTNGRDLS
jgi:hypothetical protein